LRPGITHGFGRRITAMSQNWKKRRASAGLLLGGCYLISSPVAFGMEGSANERLVAAAAQGAEGPENKHSQPLELSPVEITTITRQVMTERLQASGELQFLRRVVLRAKAGGRILDIAVREGQAVKAGDVVARFETYDLRSTLKQRESDQAASHAELLLAMQRLARSEQLVRINAVALEQLDKMKSDVTAANARLLSLSALTEIARTGLREAEVLAPFDGIVSGRAVNEGAYVGADAELLTLVDTTSLEAKILVSTQDVSRVAIGQEVELHIDGFGERLIKGTVVRKNPLADEDTRSVPVYVRLAAHPQLLGGMFVTGAILLHQNNHATIVPETALRKDESGNYVLKVLEGHLVRQPVTVASKRPGDDSVEISSGLADGDKIVVAPLPELRPSIAVTFSKAG
jgi:membrane fusion protein (multidrug efflux system)